MMGHFDSEGQKKTNLPEGGDKAPHPQEEEKTEEVVEQEEHWRQAMADEGQKKQIEEIERLVEDESLSEEEKVTRLPVRGTAWPKACCPSYQG